MKLELLSPAKNLEYGREAINHGADAVYVGAPSFGARQAATNTIGDIEALVRYAHLYGSKVFATVNTLLFDDELDDAVRMIGRLYEVGVDALIIQDLGLLQCDLPPIELHASTQCHNASVERIRFMESVGFKRVILARETALEQLRAIRAATSVDLESFVHGALCVSYSGQCYMSQYLNGRSGNRGCCSQPCRSSYDLYTGDNRLILKDQHLLSLKDFNASRHISELIAAGVSSFKIEGRLKDMAYVKNVTAYYRQLLDSMMSGHQRSSSGHTVFYFTPDVDRTFNRGYTDYFLVGRQPMASFVTQKSLGKAIGKVIKVGPKSLVINTNEPLTAGDGLCFVDQNGNLQGFMVNRVKGNEISPNSMPEVGVGTQLWRNQDHAFEKLLAGRSAERKVSVRVNFSYYTNGFTVRLIDEDNCQGIASVSMEAEAAKNSATMSEQIVKQLGKLGDSPFVATSVSDDTEGQYFLPTSVLNALRREAVDSLMAHRISYFRPKQCSRADAMDAYPATNMDYRANVVNSKAEEFYKRHGINAVEHGVEQSESYDGKALMTTKYCLRYELGCCLQGKSTHCKLAIKPTDKLYLKNNGRSFRLVFDCGECQMLVIKD